MKILNNKITTIFFSLLILVLFATGCGSDDASSNNDGETINIKLAHPNVSDHPMGVGYEKFKETVEEKSNGEINIDIYENGKYGTADEVVEGLQLNQLQMGSDSTANMNPFTDGWLAYDMPFLVEDYESADKINDGQIGKDMLNSLQDKGILGLGYIELGFRQYFNNTKPIETVEDLKAMKIRTTSSKAQLDIMEVLGANPTPIAWNEVYTALQQGTVDGVEIDLNLAYFNNFYEVQDYLTIVNSVYSPHAVLINEEFFNGLSEEHQDIIQESVEEMEVFQRNLVREKEDEIIKEMEEHGVEVNVLEPEERERFIDITSDISDKYQDTIGKELLEEFTELGQN